MISRRELITYVGLGLFGILGVLMAIPMAAIIGVLARFIFYIIFVK